MRAAREYLSQLRQQEADDEDDRRGVTGGSDEEGPSDEEEDDAVELKDRIGERLKNEAASVRGQRCMRLMNVERAMRACVHASAQAQVALRAPPHAHMQPSLPAGEHAYASTL